jgi:hypothetical protein
VTVSRKEELDLSQMRCTVTLTTPILHPASCALGAGINARSAKLAPQTTPADNGPGSAFQNTQDMENAKSTGELNLRVLCLWGGDNRAKRSTSAAGGLGTE